MIAAKPAERTVSRLGAAFQHNVRSFLRQKKRAVFRSFCCSDSRWESLSQIFFLVDHLDKQIFLSMCVMKRLFTKIIKRAAFDDNCGNTRMYLLKMEF